MNIFLVALICIGSYVLLAFLVLWIRDRIFYPRPTKFQIEEASRKLTERLLNPDFLSLERHFRHSLPPPLIELYSNKEEILRSNFEVVLPASLDRDSVYVCSYIPADNDAVTFPWLGTEAYFPFADDGCGNEFLIDPRTADPEVLFHDHETGEKTLVTQTLSQFLSAPRREARE